MEEPLVRVKNLKTHYPIKGGLLNRPIGAVKAVNGVSLDIQAGQTFGLVGESGCGKTSLMYSMASSISTGGKFLDTFQSSQRKVLFIQADESKNNS